jgi:hypothetical protein
LCSTKPLCQVQTDVLCPSRCARRERSNRNSNAYRLSFSTCNTWLRGFTMTRKKSNSSMRNFTQETRTSSQATARSVPSQASTIITGKILGKNTVSEATDTIRKYNDALDGLMRDFGNQVLLDTHTHTSTTLTCKSTI